MLDYGAHYYWQKYYHEAIAKGKAHAEEWLCSKEELSPFLETVLTPTKTVLITGCGLSQLAEKIYDQNDCRDVTCVDWSEEVIKFKAAKNSRSRAGMQYHVTDMTAQITFSHFGFDVAIDKGMLDCVMCRKDDARAAAHAVLRNVADMLRPEGKFVVISSAAPDERLPLFTFVNGPSWANVEVFHAPKASLHDARAGKLTDGALIKTEWSKEVTPEEAASWRLHSDHTFIYVLQKEKGRSLEEELKMFEGVEAATTGAGELSADDE